MIDLAQQQEKFRELRRKQRIAQGQRYDAVQALQSTSEEINSRVQSAGATDLPASDPLKIRQAELSEALPSLNAAVESTGREVRILLKELYAGDDFEQLVEQLPGDTPFLLFPVRLETRFCRVRHFAKPADKNDLLDCSSIFPSGAQANALGEWGLQKGPENPTLQVRAPFPEIPSLPEMEFNERIRQAILFDILKPASGRWLQATTDALELRIRILPDDIHLNSFEEGLTPTELERGKQFWQRIWKRRETPRSEWPKLTEVAWAELRNFFSTPRSAWCVRQTRPDNFVDQEEEEGPLPEQPQFPERPGRANGYTQAPVATGLPDFFVAILSHPGQPDRVVKGNLVRQEIATGFDPNEPDPTSFQPGDDGDIKFPEALRWIFNFDEAEKKGLGIRVPLNGLEFRAGFDKLVVLGVKLSAGKLEGKELLEETLYNQIYQERGMHVVAQGTPTNNFGSAKSGFNWPKQEADQYLKTCWEDGHVWVNESNTDPFFTKPDGLRLTEALGIDAQVFSRLPGGDLEDVREALAMNRLLFPGTMGYYIRQFFSPGESGIDLVRVFFEKFVSARGLLPAIRVGRQPYGILPATAFKFWKSLDPLSRFLFEVLLKKFDGFWEEAKANVPFAGDGLVPANQLSNDLMRLAATDPTSSLYTQQVVFGEGYLNLILRLYYRGSLGRPPDLDLNDPLAVNKFVEEIEPALQAKLIAPEMFSGFRFMHVYWKTRRLNGPLVEPLPASEDRMLAKFAGSEWNYLDWLRKSSIEDLWKERFLNVPRAPESPVPIPPKALLYHFARFALRRSALEEALRLVEPNEKLRELKTRDLELLSLVRDEGQQFTPAALDDINLLDHSLKPLVESFAIFGIQDFFLKPNRFSFFEQTIGAEQQTVKEVIQQSEAARKTAFAQQRQALEVLRGLPTARLERLFCEHLDLCSYRLDAWFNALIMAQVDRQRSAAATSQGIYLGAFGLLENVRPQRPANLVKEVEPVFADQFDENTTALPLVHMSSLQTVVPDVDELLKNSFVYLGDNPSNDCRLDIANRKVVMKPGTAPNNHGFIHGPSPEHAATAAMLRAGWQSRQAEGGHDTNTLAVRLDSPRVRGALALLEGIGQGDSLASLLGYQLERMLHDESLDSVVFKLRPDFPLKTEQAASSFAATIDGMAVINAKKNPMIWGHLGLTSSEKSALGSLLDRLESQFDAFGDLMLSESIFQMVKDSPARAAAALRTLNASGQLHQPEVARTPVSGSLVTFRTGVVFPETNFLANWRSTFTPRGLASPQLNNWLASQLPDPAKVILKVTSGEVARKLTLADIDVQPLDLLVLFPQQNLLTSTNNHLGWLAESLFRKQLTLPVDAVVNVDFASGTDPGSDQLSIFEISPLVHKLRTLLASARLLTANDFVREGGQGAAPIFATDEIELAFTKLMKDVARKPGGLGDRILAAQSDLQTELQGGKRNEVLQVAWSGLLEALTDAARWQTENSVLEFSRAFNDSQVQLLLQAAGNTGTALQRMQADADALLTQLDAAPATERFAICESLSETLFGNTVRVCPAVQLTNAPVVAQARNTDLSKNLDPLSLENWQCHSALVHPVFRMYRQVVLLREALSAPAADKPLTIIQFNSPTALPGFWVGAEMRGADPGDDVSQKFGGTLSLGIELPDNWNPQNAFTGFAFDEWTEMLPARETTTGVAFHFNQPDTEPPQVMLLAVCPVEGQNWRWEYLTETISETFERAKKRLVTFEQLKDNPAVAHLLPAVVTPLEQQNLSPTLDLGRNFQDVELDPNGAAELVSL